MEVKYKVGSSLEFSLSGEKTEDIFRQIAQIQTTFQDTSCGHCKNSDLVYVSRKAKDEDNEEHEYLEIRCNKCGCKLSYGKPKDGSSIYPKRMKTGKKGKVEKDADGKGLMLPNNGWVKFSAEPDKD